MKYFFEFVDFIAPIGLIIVGVIVTMTKVLPGIIAQSIAKSIEQQRDYDFKKALQIDSFYRQSGNSILQELMDEWIKMATDLDYMKNEGVAKLPELVQKTIGYASSRSIKIAAEFFQLSYISNAVDGEGKTIDEGKQQLANEKGIVYFAMMVASLKQDFTGEKITALDILRLKMYDYNERKEFFKKTIAEIEKSIDSKE